MYRYNDAKIDADHDGIISLFESLCEIGPSKGYSGLAREHLIRTIMHYTSAHFHREEMLMRAACYPDLREHRLAHAYMQNELRNQLRSMPKERPNLRADVLLLRKMFILHILTHDDAYGQWLERQQKERTTAQARFRPGAGTALPWRKFAKLRRRISNAPRRLSANLGRPSGLRPVPRLDEVRNGRR